MMKETKSIAKNGGGFLSHVNVCSRILPKEICPESILVELFIYSFSCAKLSLSKNETWRRRKTDILFKVFQIKKLAICQ